MALRIRYIDTSGQTLGFSLERLADGYYYDTSDGTFKAFGSIASDHRFLALTESVVSGFTGNGRSLYYATVASTPSAQFTDGEYAVLISDTTTGEPRGLLAVIMHAGDDAPVFPSASGVDPWAQSAPGSYGPGTFGNLVATNLDARVSAVKAKTDTLPSAWPSVDGAGRIDVGRWNGTAVGALPNTVAPDNTTLAHLATLLQSDGGSGYQFTATALANAPAGSGGSGSGSGSDWSEAEKQQIRYRLGIDGTAAPPSAAVPSLPVTVPDRPTWYTETTMTTGQIASAVWSTDVSPFTGNQAGAKLSAAAAAAAAAVRADAQGRVYLAPDSLDAVLVDGSTLTAIVAQIAAREFGPAVVNTDGTITYQAIDGSGRGRIMAQLSATQRQILARNYP
ncbi:MAG: hypothetical protein IRY99_02875 [Isosphaeraceae bacterium]|nr:hypothetical protein [Isosphaeraceae bacterium]